MYYLLSYTCHPDNFKDARSTWVLWKNTTFPVVAKIINALCPLNLTRQTFKSSFYTGFYSFWQKTSVVVVIIDGPMHFYLG